MSADNQTAPRPLQTAVWLLIVLNTAIYAAWFWQSGFVYRQLALWPVDGWHPFRPWQLLSYGFIHDRVFVFHLLLNMFALWSFGGLLESKLGRCRFVVFFLACIVGAGLCQLAITAAMAVNA
ncbi:MAG: rhomboid family intramembrane serine protease, partial [Pseudomonadota bacterium]